MRCGLIVLTLSWFFGWGSSAAWAWEPHLEISKEIFLNQQGSLVIKLSNPSALASTSEAYQLKVVMPKAELRPDIQESYLESQRDLRWDWLATLVSRHPAAEAWQWGISQNEGNAESIVFRLRNFSGTANPEAALSGASLAPGAWIQLSLPISPETESSQIVLWTEAKLAKGALTSKEYEVLLRRDSLVSLAPPLLLGLNARAPTALPWGSSWTLTAEAPQAISGELTGPIAFAQNALPIASKHTTYRIKALKSATYQLRMTSHDAQQRPVEGRRELETDVWSEEKYASLELTPAQIWGHDKVQVRWAAMPPEEITRQGWITWTNAFGQKQMKVFDLGVTGASGVFEFDAVASAQTPEATLVRLQVGRVSVEKSFAILPFQITQSESWRAQKETQGFTWCANPPQTWQGLAMLSQQGPWVARISPQDAEARNPFPPLQKVALENGAESFQWLDLACFNGGLAALRAKAQVPQIVWMPFEAKEPYLGASLTLSGPVGLNLGKTSVLLGIANFLFLHTEVNQKTVVYSLKFKQRNNVTEADGTWVQEPELERLPPGSSLGLMHQENGEIQMYAYHSLQSLFRVFSLQKTSASAQALIVGPGQALPPGPNSAIWARLVQMGPALMVSLRNPKSDHVLTLPYLPHTQSWGKMRMRSNASERLYWTYRPGLEPRLWISSEKAAFYTLAVDAANLLPF